jgi:hypothetical protein
MKPAHWLVALLAIAAVCWWTLGHPGYETREQRVARVEAAEAAVEAAKPKLYRWHDGNGVLQLTDTPPSGRKFEVVDLEAQENVNVIPMSEAINPPNAAAKGKSGRK